MRTLLITVALLTTTTPVAAAAIPVDVRVEGANRTIFEGPVNSDIRQVRASSDTTTRKCDGTNNGANPQPSPSALSATADALALRGQGFDGTWYPGFEEYLVSRLGSESSGSWGLYRNDVRSDVGGCQLAVGAGDSVLWAAGTGGGGTAVLRMSVTGSNPFDVTATDASGAPVAGATVYDADADGDLSSTGVATGADGRASVRFSPGYHRLKVGKSGFVRSARALVCAQPCDGQPPADAVAPNLPSAARAGVRVSRPTFRRTGDRLGLVRLSWRLTRVGVGIRSWSIVSDDLSTSASSFRFRDRGGSSATSASLRLPVGRVHALRFLWTDRLLRPGQADFGRVLVPIDDRSRSVRRRGAWRKVRSASAWRGTLLRGRRGARLRVRLAPGRPALLARGRRSATVRIGSRRVRVRPGRRTVLGVKRAGAGVVTMSVVSGSIDLDGVAASP